MHHSLIISLMPACLPQNRRANSSVSDKQYESHRVRESGRHAEGDQQIKTKKQAGGLLFSQLRRKVTQT